MESHGLSTVCVPWPSECGKVVRDVFGPKTFPTLVCVFAPTRLKQDHDYLKKALVRYQPHIIICDGHPKGITMTPDLLKVCQVKRQSWFWSVDTAALWAAQSRQRKVLVFARARPPRVNSLRLFYLRCDGS